LDNEQATYEYLDVEDLLALASQLLGDPVPVRDVGLLTSAAARPASSPFGEDAYRDVWQKAAALLQSLVKNHALVDGNKRLGWLATAVFLELNGVSATRAANDDVYDFVMDVAGEHRTVEEIALDIRRIVGDHDRWSHEV
jgi:death-on-curing protein